MPPSSPAACACEAEPQFDEPRSSSRVPNVEKPGRLVPGSSTLKHYPAPTSERPHAPSDFVSPLILSAPSGPLSFLTTTTVFGTANDVTLAELTIESFFPADPATAERLGTQQG